MSLTSLHLVGGEIPPALFSGKTNSSNDAGILGASVGTSEGVAMPSLPQVHRNIAAPTYSECV